MCGVRAVILFNSIVKQHKDEIKSKAIIIHHADATTWVSDGVHWIQIQIAFDLSALIALREKYLPPIKCVVYFH